MMAVILYLGTGIFYKALVIHLIRIRPLSAAERIAQTEHLPIRESLDTYRIISERNIFGTTTKAVSDNWTATAKPQQDITLLIELKGTIAGGVKHGYAIIEEKVIRKQRLVKMGDVVAGAKIVRIRRKAIDLLVNSQESTLEILDAKKGPIMPPLKALEGAVSSGPIVVNRSVIQEAMANIGNTMNQAQIRPYVNAGVPSGFIIGGIRPGSFYQKMGIVNGDIIQEVNNRKIRTIEDALGLLTAIKSGTSLSLGIKRREKLEVLSYQFQ